MAPSGSSSSMASDFKIGATAFLLTMWIGYFLITGAAAIPREELDFMIPVLHRRGYNRFGNSIKTSDLIKDCLAFDNLTVSAPAEESMEMAHTSGESGLRSHAVSDLIHLPSPAILAALLPNHTVSIAVHRTRRRTVHIAVNGVTLQSPGLYHSSHVAIHGLAGALIIPLSRFPSCCLPQSPIRDTLEHTPSLSAYAGPLRPQSATSNGDLLPPPPPDISIGFSISSTVAALTAAAIAAGVIIHLFRPHLAPLNDDMDNLGQHFAPPKVNLDGLVLIIQMILNTLRQQRISIVQINDETGIFSVSEQLVVRLRSLYASRLNILRQRQYEMHRTPDDVIMVVEMPDRSSFHLGLVPHFFMNGVLYDNSYVVRISRVDVAPAA